MVIATADLQRWLQEAPSVGGMGWIPDERGLVTMTEHRQGYEALAASFDQLLEDEPDDDGDRYPWRLFLKERPELFAVDPRTNLPRMKARNQGNAGTCVGAATAQDITILKILDIILRGQPEVYKWPVSIEWCYAAGRQIAGQLGNWDGSTNSWQLRALLEWGVLFETKYGDIDLSSYSPSRAQEWARRGTPASLRPTAGETKLLQALRIRSVDQWWRCLGLGYTINLCSNWGGTGKRDAEGVMRRSGTWSHSMASWWRRMSQRYGRLFGVQNSWSSGWAESSADTEEPDDMPWGGFYLTEEEAAWVVRTGEVIAYVDLDGFKRPRADWENVHGWTEAGYRRGGPRPPRVPFDLAV